MRAGVLTVDPPAPLKVKQNAEAELRIRVTVAEGYHIQANPPSHDFLIPLQLKLRRARGIEVGPPRYPPAQLYYLRGVSDPLLTYGGAFELLLPLRVQGDVPPGAYVLNSSLRYQACDSHSCLMPSERRLKLHVEVQEHE